MALRIAHGDSIRRCGGCRCRCVLGLDLCGSAKSQVRAGSKTRLPTVLFGFSAGAPLPHAKHRLLRQGVAHLAGEHANLAAMVAIVRDEIAEESGYVGAE